MKAVGELLGMVEEPVNLRGSNLLAELDRFEPEQGVLPVVQTGLRCYAFVDEPRKSNLRPGYTLVPGNIFNPSKNVEAS